MDEKFVALKFHMKFSRLARVNNVLAESCILLGEARLIANVRKG